MADATTSTPDVAAAVATLSASASGKTTIDDGVISKIVGIVTREVPGVYALGGNVSRAIGAIRDAINQTDRSQGVSVEVGERQVAVDITLVAEYPVSLQKVADDVRAAVHTAIEDIVGMDVTEVNVTINDVHILGDDDAVEEAPKAARVQ